MRKNGAACAIVAACRRIDKRSGRLLQNDTTVPKRKRGLERKRSNPRAGVPPVVDFLFGQIHLNIGNVHLAPFGVPVLGVGYPIPIGVVTLGTIAVALVITLALNA